MSKKIIIRPIAVQSPVVRFDRVTDKSRSESGTVVETTVSETDNTRAPGTRQTICAAPSISRGGLLNTGLDEMIDNPFKDLKSYKAPEWSSILKGVEQILRQTELEYKHGRKPGYYTNIPSNENTEKKDIPFFQTAEAQLNLNDGATVLDLDLPTDEIKYWICRANNLVANTFDEIIIGQSKYVITSESEDAIQKASKDKVFDRAISFIVEIDNKADDTIIDFCKVLNKSKKEMSRSQAYTELTSFVKTGNQAVASFDTIYRMFKENREKFVAFSLLKDLEDYGVVHNRGAKYTWYQPVGEDGKTPEPLVFDRKDDIVAFLLDPKYSPELEVLQKQLSARRRGL